MKEKNKVHRVVIKVGSSSLSHENGKLNISFIGNLAWELASLRNQGIELVLVSSGSIAAGLGRLNLKARPKDVVGKQAASAVGQASLMQMYNKAFAEYGYAAAQVLLTKQIERDPIMKSNGINTFEKLLSLEVIPVVNENDAISTYEIEFGDNDTLSAVVARMIGADLLVLLTDIDGLYEEDPRKNPLAKKIDLVEEIDDRIYSMGQGSGSDLGTGGMATKIKAAQMATEKGIDVVIAHSNKIHQMEKIIGGENIGTYFTGKNPRDW